MTTIIITRIYDEIIEYYSNTDFGAVIIEPTISDTNTSIQSDIDVSCDFFETDDAYRIYVSDDLIEDSNEKIRRYLTRHFSYLMKNVFYLDTKKYKAKGAKGTFFIYKRDYPIIKEILLRSVSQNEHDIIIGKWLNGKIKDNDYYEIVKLSERLFYVIRNIEENESDITERWITALKLALRTDFAYTMIEVEFSIYEIFSYSLPFKIEQKSTVQFEEKSDFEVCHTYFSNSILNHLDTNDEKAQNTIYKIIYAKQCSLWQLPQALMH